MKMHIREFACLTGVSVRTLHYYDEIGLLKPANTDEQTGYRFYDEKSLERMQEILFYRELDFPLKRISEQLSSPHYNKQKALSEQKKLLQRKKKRLERLIERIEQIEREDATTHMNAWEPARKTSLTSFMSAFGRAFHHQIAEKPVFDDTKARELMGEEEYKRIAGYILGGMDFFAPEKKGSFASLEDTLRYLVYTQIAPTPIARARFCEDSLKAAMRTGTGQYVILGAGMDTFPFREPEFVSKHKVYEVDHPMTQADKLERIRRAGWKIPDNLFFVLVDFSKDSLKDKLLEAGFDKRKKTFFSWLGVSYYLTTDEIENVLTCLAALSAEGSTLLFDYADEGLFTSSVKRVQNMIAMAAAGGEPLKTSFSYHQLEKLLEKHRFLIYELLTTQDIQNQYFANRTDELTAFEYIHYVTAVIR